MNPVAEALTGWTSADSLNQPMDRVCPLLDEGTGQPVTSPVTRVLREGTVVGLGNHTVLVNRNGKHIPIEDSAAPIRSKTGQMLGVIMIFHDVTEERAHENALRESEARFRVMSDTAPVMIWTSGTDTLCDYVNQSWLDFTGRTFADEVSRGWAQGVHPDDLTPILTTYRTAFTARQPFTVEYRLRRHDGSYRWIVDHGVPRTAPDGTFAGYIGSCLDVTEQRQTLAYTEQLQTLTSALNSAVTPVQVAEVIMQATVNSLGSHLSAVATLDDDQQITYLHVYGMADDVLAARGPRSLDDSAPMTAAIRSHEALWIETRADFLARFPQLEVMPGGVRAICANASLPLKVEGRTIGGLTISFPTARVFGSAERTFITALAEQCALALDRARLFLAEQKARQDAEAADRLKLEFLALISHELRTPLASIKGFATTMMADDVQFDSETQRSFVGIIDEEADRLTELIEQLLDLSRLQAGNLRIKPQPTPFDSILDTAMAQFETLTIGHQLIIHLPPDLPLLMADAPRIAQVLVNLVGNATKFAPPHSQIMLTASAQGGMARIEVSDHGLGIPVEARRYVFDPFRQVEDNAATQKGAGLGLAICRGLVSQHGGEIWIEDRPGGGTTFAFTIPIATSLSPGGEANSVA
jgi:PAS domain S-box-containing protein